MTRGSRPATEGMILATREFQCQTCHRVCTYDTSDPNKQSGHASSCVYWNRVPKDQRPKK